MNNELKSMLKEMVVTFELQYRIFMEGLPLT
jgi:hypothetical protein